ncbi:MAG: methylenetetrahydrofolate--tRNA-(uracil(54)-C(5))-methyltransferase (FADH(2)-oxidizing) TrmFO [Oscillospiraceae bacterium]|nr:methylenetetrahydrofolate--tRNA-(uracil(54)-C(5))-methyltransferase (FADH(2)-oxidizing) TrmFO [Oscillospiraceae bacterium]
MRVRVIGAGLAGCEAAAALSRLGCEVELCEQKPQKYSPAHKSSHLAELVCSNSFKSADEASAAGLLKAEMRLMGSLCLKIAEGCAVPAGGALAVDRELFSKGVSEAVEALEGVSLVRGEVTEIDREQPAILATGPLTEGELAKELFKLCGTDALSFYDAAAPIVTAASLDMSRVHAASRYGKGGADYLNCYFDKEGYEAFQKELVKAETAPVHDFDYKVYEGCMPIEKLARRGPDAMRFGPLKPVGLTDPATGRRPWAAVQLRRENAEGELYNIVGFQTNLKFGEQKRVFSMIPGLEKAEFARYGVMHRNSFINSPECLDGLLAFKSAPLVFAAGQLTGVEGYMESAMCGIMAARLLYAKLEGKSLELPPPTTMCGALLGYIARPNKDFQPMGANMGLLPPLGEHIRNKKERYAALSARALKDMKEYLNENNY